MRMSHQSLRLKKELRRSWKTITMMLILWNLLKPRKKKTRMLKTKRLAKHRSI
ncbi:hypothetical protein E1A91_A12G282800v1 [Gossypium mustelinum]|uniref:Uncharacterized protein n=1 Tax=Gossypium mustelinum TaxID=34275 RepID=A0A5D2X000_GOSMU|nr:hypothetical protein E1A91_A12G282800v1 [Gossypium mustelinum]